MVLLELVELCDILQFLNFYYTSIRFAIFNHFV